MAEAVGSSQFLLILHSIPWIGEKRLARILHLLAQHRRTPEEFLALDVADLRDNYELDSRSARYMVHHRSELLSQSAEVARLIRSHPLHVLTAESATYPARLVRNDDSPPPILYALGNATLLDDSASPSDHFTFTVAVSNAMPQSTLDRQDEIAAELVAAGGVPVTGHDRTPFKRLALAAQRRNRPTIYIFDRGLREALGPDFDRPPFAAARIRDTVFDTTRDLALSSFRLDDHGLGENNRRRDHLIFSLSDLIIALDVRSGGAMEAECLRAHHQGRSVFVDAGGRDGNTALRASGCTSILGSIAELLKDLI